jgi:hypothetical protein
MERVPAEGMKCDKCSTGFKEVGELAKHKLSHETGRMEDDVTQSDSPHIGNHRPREGLSDILAPAPPIRLDESNEEARSERELIEGQRSDRANAQSNRAEIYNYRDESEWEVNPNQTPKQANTIRPIPYV